MVLRGFFALVLAVSLGGVLSGCGGAGGQLPGRVEAWKFGGAEFAASLPAEAEPIQLGEDPQLSDYLGYAALHNPALEAAFNDWIAALQRVPQVRALPDPRLTYRYFIKEVETRVGAQRQGFELAQRFPWFGKLDLRGDAAAQSAEAARQRYEAAKLKLFNQVKHTYYEYYYLGRAIATTRENLKLLKYVESVTRARYKVAAASHPNVIRAQVELGKLDDRLRELQDLRGPVLTPP